MSLTNDSQNWWLCEPVYVVSNMAIKASIAVMLYRLSVRPTHKIILWITTIVTEVYSLFFFFLFIFQCSPSQYFWTRLTGGTGSCLDTNIIVSATYGYSAITCFSDLVYSILPVLLVWSLQMGRKEKAAVVVILAMGAMYVQLSQPPILKMRPELTSIPPAPPSQQSSASPTSTPLAT